MSEDKADGYEKLEKTRNESYSRPTAESFSELCLPVDKYNMVYIASIFGGIGFLLPYNSFIMAADYFKTRFPENPVVFDMSLVYIVTALITVVGNNFLVDVFSMHSRIKYGYLISFTTLFCVIIFEIGCDLGLKLVSSYTAHLIAIAIIAIGCTIQQSSFYGYSSMLPPKFTHAAMVGESVAGVLTSISRISTRFFVKDLRLSTISFFAISFVLVAFCSFLYPRIRKSDFIRFYINLCERDKTKITLEPREDAGMMEICDSRYGVLKIQTSPPPTSNIISFANPVYEPTDQGARPTYKVEDVIFIGRNVNQSNRLGWTTFKDSLRDRWNVTKKIYPYMVSIFLVYFTTLCLYPGIASEIESRQMGYWMPMLMMIDFNCADAIGKIVTCTNYWTGSRLLKFSIARLIMIPLMVLCVMPFWHLGVFSNDLLAFTYSILLGLSNGLLGSIPMVQAPTKVARCYRELAGNMMTLFYMWGLATGSLGAFSIEKIIRPMKAHHHSNFRFQHDDPLKPFLSQNITSGELTAASTTPSMLITTIMTSLITMNGTESI